RPRRGLGSVRAEALASGGPARQGVGRRPSVRELPDAAGRGDRWPDPGQGREGADPVRGADRGLGCEEPLRPPGRAAHDDRGPRSAVRRPAGGAEPEAPRRLAGAGGRGA
ncbi:MAG: hypothetical protein AN487_24025, partial [Anabaena sp. CRKS33]